MGKRSDWKKNDGIADWDMDAKCRRIVDQSTPARRRLRSILRRRARRRRNMNRDDAIRAVKNCSRDSHNCDKCEYRKYRAQICEEVMHTDLLEYISNSFTPMDVQRAMSEYGKSTNNSSRGTQSNTHRLKLRGYWRERHMTKKDAAVILRENRSIYDRIDGRDQQFVDALDIAIDALEPVPPDKHDPVLYGCSYTCGACYRRIWEGDKYCRSCGKPVKWDG